MLFQIELTDTFNGEANYCWVKRATFEAPADAPTALLVRRAKRALELQGRHVTSEYGDTVQLDFPGACICAFITHKE